MNIIIVSSINHRTPAYHLINAFKISGHDVISFSDTASDLSDFVVPTAFKLRDYLEIESNKLDLLLYIEGGSMEIFPLDLIEIDAKKFWWGIDTHLNFEKHLRISRLFDHTFIAQKEFLKSLALHGIEATWLPLAYPSSIEIAPRASASYDFSFIGQTDPSMYPERYRLIKKAQQAFPNNFVGNLEPKEMLEVYNNSRVVINQSIKNDINMRVFEVLGTSAVLVTNAIHENGLEDLFENTKQLFTFETDEELISILKLLIENDETRIETSAAANELIFSHHTYFNRANEIVEFVSKSTEGVKISLLDYSAALLQIGMFVESLNFFVLEMKSKAQSRKTRLVVLIMTPFLSFGIRIAGLTLRLVRGIKVASRY